MPPLTGGQKRKSCTEPSPADDRSTANQKRPTKRIKTEKTKPNEKATKRKVKPSLSKPSRSSRSAAPKSRKPTKRKTQPDSKSSYLFGTEGFSDSSVEFVDEYGSADQRPKSNDDFELSVEAGESSEISPIELQNGQNWCYLNSVFQALRSTKPINEYLSAFPVAFVEISALFGTASLAFSFINDFQKVISQSSTNKKTTQQLSNTADTILTDSSGTIRGSSQQDAHEFFNTLTNSIENLEEMISSILETIPKEKRLPPFKETLTGGRRVLLVCQKCSGAREKEESWTSLSLPVLRSTDISSMIEAEFAKSMHLDGLLCTECNKNTPTVRSDSLLKAPKALVLQLQNAKLGNDGMRKTDHTVHIPEVFGIMDEAKSVCVYDLSGAVVHIGRDVYSGHYVAYSFDADETCLRCDDRNVKRFSPRRQDGNVYFQKYDETPYLLIYTKREDEQ